MPAEEYAHDNGVQIVDRLAELSEHKRELNAALRALEGEEETLKGAAYALAEKLAVARLYGHDKQLNIRDVLRVHYPHSGDGLREPFEDELRAMGLWEQAAAVSVHALARLAEAHDWVRVVPERLAPYMTVAWEKMARLARRRNHEEDD